MFNLGSSNDAAAVLKSLSRAMAVIEFEPNGTVITANENFCNALGYTLNEIKGKHHRIFCDPAYTASPEYSEFWAKLGRGEFDAREYKRIRKDGSAVWIQASYNPVFNNRGKVVKVVKAATDITGRIEAVNALASAINRLADNDLKCEIDRTLDPAFEELRANFNRSVGILRDSISQVANGARSIHAGAAEIGEASEDLSRRTEQQAASLEETAAALNELTQTVKQSAEGANAANETAAKARTAAEKSGEVMNQAVSAMDNIEKSSNKITQIIGVIDEIAFQTNLLALNAGVEAARAGEAGRGFAVVASEVRALAQRSADAAKEIKALIAASSDQVKHGVELVGNTGRELKNIVEQVKQINTLISNIAQSSQQQSTGLAEVNIAVNQMDQTTQQNAAMVEEATAAVGNLRREAEKLNSVVGQFNLGEVRQSAPPARHTPAPRHQPHTPAPSANPVGKVQAKLAVALKSGGAQPKEEEWAEF